MEINLRTKIDTTFQGQKAQLSVCTDKCLSEVGKKTGPLSALEGSIGGMVNYE